MVPDTFAPGEVDVVSVVNTAVERKAISPLIYGINTGTVENNPADVMRGVTWVRRGGDRANSYNWETNVSNGSWNNNFSNDLFIAAALPDQNAPAAVDLANIKRGRAAGRGAMVPFVLNDWVAGPVSANIPYATASFKRAQYFRKVELVKPTPFAATPDPGDGFVYTDEHLQFLRNQFPGQDVLAPGPDQLMVGIDNEPDLYHYNFPMLQEGTGKPLYASNGVKIGQELTPEDFTLRYLKFVTRVKDLAPNAYIVGPDHYHYDGFTSWNQTLPQYSDKGRWYMDDFLRAVKEASLLQGRRLLDTWDFHWYPQGKSNDKWVWDLDDSVRPLTVAEIEQILQGTRSYWDTSYDESSWITRDHLYGPAYILTRLFDRLEAGYPGTKLGVSEYFPGGCAHISSGLGVVDTLGVFGRMGVHLAAMWPTCSRLEYAFGGIKLLRNADGNGLAFANTAVRVEHPERAPSSVYAGSDSSKRVTVTVINKTDKARSFGLRAFHPERLTSVAAYRIDATHASPALASKEALSKFNAYAYAAPPLSATMLVFTAP